MIATKTNLLAIALLAIFTTTTTVTAQCVNKTAVANILQAKGVDTPAGSLDFDSCVGYCTLNKYKFVGLQYIERRVTTGMSGCSVYDGSFCYCANDLGNSTIPVGFDSPQPGNGFCGDCNTGLSCGAGGHNIDNPSQFKGKTCGIQYIFDVERDPASSSNTTIKDAVYFYPINGSTSTTSNSVTSYTSTVTAPTSTVTTYKGSSSSSYVNTSTIIYSAAGPNVDGNHALAAALVGFAAVVALFA
ncbi:hypothetical protein HDU76_008842 [Blyttiomyces sp. JEL0837]|nr:hypothetical protein HDU76_008842 [Blyttiomyces sp. JEL0837]